MKEEEVTRLKAENESTLKEERDRIEMIFQEKMAKVETEKDALVKLVKTTKIMNTVLEEELKKAKKDMQGAEEDKKVLEGELRQLGELVKLFRQEKDQSSKDFKRLQKVIEQNDVELEELNDNMGKVEQDSRLVCLMYLCVHTYLPTYEYTQLNACCEYVTVNIEILWSTYIRMSPLQGCVLTT